MTTIYLIRHAQSVGNTNGIVSGQINIGLTRFGMNQAELIAEYFEGKKIDRIYSSDLNRTKNTIKPTAKKLGLEIISDKELREISLGDWEGMLYSELKELYPEELYSWMNNRLAASRVPGGESFGELYERMKNIMFKIARENEGKTIIVTSHAISIRAFLCFASGYTDNDHDKIGVLSNAGINILTFENDVFTPVEINITSHLDEFQSGNKPDDKPLA
jgi:probable phosphoglycerate mutase